MLLFAEGFGSLLELEGVSEGGLAAWTDELPPRIPDLPLTQLIHALMLLLLAAAHGSRVRQTIVPDCAIAQGQLVQRNIDHGRGEK